MMNHEILGCALRRPTFICIVSPVNQYRNGNYKKETLTKGKLIEGQPPGVIQIPTCKTNSWEDIIFLIRISTGQKQQSSADSHREGIHAQQSNHIDIEPPRLAVNYSMVKKSCCVFNSTSESTRDVQLVY